MAEHRKEFGVATTLLVAIGVGVFTINASPSNGQVASSSQSSPAAPGSDVVTVTSVTGELTTVTSSLLGCPQNAGASVTQCLYLGGWAFNYTSSGVLPVIILVLGYCCSGSITPATLNITFSGSPTNEGFTGSVNLDGQSLPQSIDYQEIASPTLSNLQRGDQVIVTITGTAGEPFTTTFTAGSPSTTTSTVTLRATQNETSILVSLHRNDFSVLYEALVALIAGSLVVCFLAVVTLAKKRERSGSANADLRMKT